MTQKPHFLVTVAFAATAAFGLASPAAAEFPESSVTYVIPFNPGGGSDQTARMKESYFTKLTGQKFIMSYRPGAGGGVAWSGLNAIKGNGYTIMGTNLPHFVTQPLLGKVGYETDDITNIYVFHYTPHALMVAADSPFKSLAELVKEARDKPGAVTFAGSGTNSANHLAQRKFDKLADIKTTYVPMAGATPAQTAILGGHVTAAWLDTASAARLGSKVRVLAAAKDERLSLFPDTPTFKELGYDMVGGTHRGVAVPKSTSEDLRQAWSNLIDQIAKDPAFIKTMEAGGYAVTHIGYDKMDAFMKETKEEFTELLKNMGAIK
jgi:tripartite-type tricarboxylate transporter receptor subunit TctC